MSDQDLGNGSVAALLRQIERSGCSLELDAGELLLRGKRGPEYDKLHAELQIHAQEVASALRGEREPPRDVTLTAHEGLDITAKRNGKAATSTVTVSLDGNVLDCQSVNLTKPKDRDTFIESICERHPEIDSETLKSDLIKEAARLANPERKPAQQNRSEPELLLSRTRETVREDARAILEDPNLLKHVVDDIEALGVAGERELTATIYLVGTSRLLSKPLAAIVQGPSSSGKSYLIEKTATLFPPEAVLVATQMTPQSLFYMDPGALCHRFVVAGERSRVENDDTAEATRALREMLSAGKLSKLIPVKDGGKMKTELIEQDGPIAFVESTTLSTIFDEDRNRAILLHTDERANQTRRIIDRLAAGYCGNASGDIRRIIDRHHAIQRMLQRWPIVIPYAGRLAELFTSDRVEVRRAFPQLMSMVQSCCLLHQFQRQFDDGRLIATVDDYKIARYLLAGPMSRLLGGRTSDPAQRFFDRLTARFAVDHTFTSTEAAAGESATRRAVTGWLSELCDAGVVEQVAEHKGSRPATWKVTSTELNENDCPELPTVKDVSA